MPKIKNVNSNFFLAWSRPMAYVLGYFAADGSMIRNKRGGHFIEFTSKDRELLDLIQALISSDHKISRRGDPNNQYYRFQIGSKKIFDNLGYLGFTTSKSLSISFPLIPTMFFNDFVRGYFDGDGHVSIVKNGQKSTKIIQSGFTSGSKKFLEELHTNLKKYANIQGGSLYYHQGFRLNFSVKDSLLLYKSMYQDIDGMFLKRKYNVFVEYFNLTPWTGSSVG